MTTTLRTCSSRSTHQGGQRTHHEEIRKRVELHLGGYTPEILLDTFQVHGDSTGCKDYSPDTIQSAIELGVIIQGGDGRLYLGDKK